MMVTISMQISELIKNFLDIKAIEYGKVNLSMKKLDILPTVQWLVNRYAKLAKAKELTLQF